MSRRAATARQVANSAESSKAVPPALAGDRLGHGGGIAAHSQVEVDHLPPQRRVADSAAGDPDSFSPGQRPSRQGDRRRRARRSATLTPLPAEPWPRSRR